MSTAHHWQTVAEEDYLAGELGSPVKREYVGGVVYAMGGARNRHNLVASNALAALWSRLRGKPCRAFNSDTKIRISLPGHTRYYYPDASVVCKLGDPNQTFQEHPVVVVEVLSDSTRRVDRGEKRDAYLNIPSLAVYLLVEPDSPQVLAYRRTPNGFEEEHYAGEDVIALMELGIELPLSELYEA